MCYWHFIILFFNLNTWQQLVPFTVLCCSIEFPGLYGNNKLHAIMPQIDEKYYSGCTNRKDEVIINRLRIGHTRLTHSFRMENRPHPPLCDQCEGDHELTVKHILIECSFLKIIRRRHYDVTDLNQLFKTVSSKRILDFVKDIGLYNSLQPSCELDFLLVIINCIMVVLIRCAVRGSWR